MLGVLVAAAALSVAMTGSAADAVAVPDVAHTGLAPAYALLWREGFRVSVSAPARFGFLCQADVAAQSPSAGVELARGALVTLRPAFGGCGSPPPAPAAVKLPKLVGRRLTAASEHLRTRGPVFWRASLPMLPPSCGTQLFDNYRVTAQKPRAGTVVHPFLPNPDGTMRITYVDLRLKTSAVRCPK
jgi:hypothetical protein